MSKGQLFIFAILLSISLTFIFLSERTDLYISNYLSEFLLFPINVFSDYFQYLYISQKKIDLLETEISRLQIENQQLKDRLNLITSQDTISLPDLRILKANIIGRDPQNFNGFLYIDKGHKDGLHINAPVLFQNKIVGKIKFLSENTGIVETIENPGFAISAMDIRSGIVGIAKKKRELHFEYIKIEDDVMLSDSLYTSGLSENFPRGLMIGTVSDIRKKEGDLFFREVIIKPAISVNMLNYVYVIY